MEEVVASTSSNTTTVSANSVIEGMKFPRFSRARRRTFEVSRGREGGEGS